MKISFLGISFFFLSLRKQCTLVFFIFGPLRPQIGKKLDFGHFWQFLMAFDLVYFQKMTFFEEKNL